MLSLYVCICFEPTEDVLIYILKLFCRNICNFPMNICFQFFFRGNCCKLCPTNNSRRKKSQGLSWGECSDQIRLMIIVSMKTRDKACTDICAVGGSIWGLLKPDI